MKICLLFCLLSIALAGSYEDESSDGNGLNIGGINNFGDGAIYPFDAFNLGYDKLFSRIHPPLIAAMNTFVPTLESAKSQSESASQTYEEQSVSSKSEEVKSSSHSSASNSASEAKQSISESRDTSKSSIKSASIEEQKKSDSSMSNVSGEKEQSASSQSRKASVEISSSNSESSSKTIHSKYESEIAPNAEEKSQSSYVSSSNSKRDEMSETSQLSSEENQSKSESKFKSISSEKDLGKSRGESSDIDSDAPIFVLKSVEKSESEVDRVLMSKEEAEDVKSSAVSSDGVELNSAQEGNKKESDPETDVRSVFENASSSSEKIGSFAMDKPITIEMDSTEAGLSFNPAYVNDEMTCDTGESVPDSWIESEIQHSHRNKDLAHNLSVQDVRKALEDGYKDLAQMKKRLFKKQIVINDLNQVISDLQTLCDKICQEVPVKYLMS